jgi:aminoglycoside phosphotransferase family enzyme
MDDATTALPEVPLVEKVRFLSAAGNYPERPAQVEVRETHMSWVFLTDTRVYKLKKPVTYPFLDFSTLGARAARCRDEVRLNRRLAPDVYLGVSRLARAAGGALALDGDGDVIEYLVCMRRLPAARMLDRLIADRAVTRADIAALGAVLGDFYAKLPGADLAPDRYVEQLRREQAINLDALGRRAPLLDGAALDQIGAAIDALFGRVQDELAARARRGHVVEGHGDLRPEHVCVLAPPVVIDCLEFNRALRLVDPFEEIAFLGLECTRLGAPWIGSALRQQLESALNDRVSDALFALYTALRACLRARLALAHLYEPTPRTPEKWPVLARQYLQLADRCVSPPSA